MSLRFAIVGFRHPHINSLVAHLKERDDVQLVAACEEDATAREQVAAANVSENLFDSYEKLLDEVECDVIGIGDYYGRRGALALEALRRGKHIISDKPICISLAELDQIEALAREKDLRIGCQLDMRDAAPFRRLRELVQSGEMGEIHAISFGGQHPLNYGTRAGWYFEEGKHGGTINDIAIHALDYIPFLTGKRWSTINAARNWNARLPQVPHFKDAGQLMMTLQNGCGVLGDVSYIVPDSFGYTLPHYWRTTVWGENGLAETAYNAQEVLFYRNGDKEPQRLAATEHATGKYLADFIAEVQGQTTTDQLTTATVLESSRVSLLTQQAADEGLTNVQVP